MDRSRSHSPDAGTTFGRPHRHFRVTDSTNERARELALAGAPSGAVVTAAEQTAGRGRRGRSWTAPAGKALLCSAILRPLGREHALLPLSVPLAVCEAIESLAPVDCQVKWPNDVWIREREALPGDGQVENVDAGPSAKPDAQGRKAAGVLIEAQPPEWAVIGIGLNVAIKPEEFPADLRHPAVSVANGVAVDEALAAVCEQLGVWVEAKSERVLAEFRRRDALRGSAVSWEGSGEGNEGVGVADGIDERGNLIVVTAEGERLRLGSGEVMLIPR
jgi:BirA family biotin operon repressor/biotin-[acetyl-CoA-carboxylase] ligase